MALPCLRHGVDPWICQSKRDRQSMPYKELWQIQVNRRRLPNGMISHQVLNKNFIPIQDVFELIERSNIPEKEAIGKYLKTLTPLDDPSDKQGVIAS